MNRYLEVKNRLSEILSMIDKDEPIAEICRRLNIKPETLQKHLRSLGVFYNGNQGRRGIATNRNKTPIEKYLSNEVRVNASKLRKRLIDDGFKECKCEKCDRTEWEGGLLPLELHHKNFNHYDNSLDNLEILCSNCHSQVHQEFEYKHYLNEKFNGTDCQMANGRKKKYRLTCQYCGTEFYSKNKKQKYCSVICSHKSYKKTNISKGAFLKMLTNDCNFTSIGKKLGVSDNCVSKMCTRFGLPCKIKELKKFLNIK